MIMKGVGRGGRSLFKSFLSTFILKDHLGLPQETTMSSALFSRIIETHE
jgi:hypothetical protein